MRYSNCVLRSAFVAGLLLSWNPLTASLRAQSETFVATASLPTGAAGAQVTAPLTVVVTRPTTDKERTVVVEALKKGGSAGVVEALKPMPDIGYIELGGRRTALKYAYVRVTSGGRIVTVVTPTPILYLGAGVPGAKPKTGFDLAIALLEVKDAGPGYGELVPAAKVKLNEAGALETEDYGAAVVHLTDVRVKK